MKLSDIRIRDPFILNDGGKYYLYGTTRLPEDGIGEGDFGFDVYVSSDLISFEGPFSVFDEEEGFFGVCDYWAPEVYKVDGAYYMLASFKGRAGLHGVGILKAEDPKGPFRPHSKMPITPNDWAAIDGTLYYEDGKPYMIFVHEWSQIVDGTMCYAELSPDLTHFTSGPQLMLSASENPFGRPSRMRDGREGYITDGPCMYKTKGGELLMLWSMKGERGYMECVYKSKSGSLRGKFEPHSLLYGDDGGHGMIFEDNSGTPRFVLHTPNTRGLERAKIFEIIERDGGIALK